MQLDGTCEINSIGFKADGLIVIYTVTKKPYRFKRFINLLSSLSAGQILKYLNWPSFQSPVVCQIKHGCPKTK